MLNKYLQRYDVLNQEAEAVLATKHFVKSEFTSGEYLDQNILDEWRIKAKNLLSKSCGLDSEHYKEYITGEKPHGFESNLSLFKRLKSIFNAAKDDFEGGYLVSIKSLVQAELFDSELEQAKELLSSGYRLAAAVIAGIVLETALRDLCDRNNLAHSKLDKMNADLAKIGFYNKLQQKRITALADIRNSAAHGKPEEFTQEDIELMISDIERFLVNYLGE